MTFFKPQFNTLVCKVLILLLAGISLSLPNVNAQQVVDTNNIITLYDSSKIYYAAGEYSKAIRVLNKVLSFKKNMPNDSKPEYFKIYNLLGVIYKKQGDLNRAIDFYKKALEKTSDSYYLSLINDNLANIYSLRGDYAKAIYCYENTLSVLEKSNDVNKSRYIVENYYNLGYSYYKLGNYYFAMDRYLKSIKLAERNRLGGVGETYYSYGLVYQKLDSLDKANFCFQKAITCNIKEFGENHYTIGMAYMNYAAFYSDIGDYKNSSRLYKKALAILLNTLGDKHSYTSLCLKNIGLLNYQLNLHKQALNYFQRSLIARIYSFNDNSICVNPSSDVLPDMDLLVILKLKAQTFIKLAEYESREENLKSALATLELAATFTERLRTGYL